MPKLARMWGSFGAPLQSLPTSYQRVWVPRWKPIPMQLMTVASVSVVARAAVEPSRSKKHISVACTVVSEMWLTQTSFRGPPSDRWSFFAKQSRSDSAGSRISEMVICEIVGE